MHAERLQLHGDGTAVRQERVCGNVLRIAIISRRGTGKVTVGVRRQAEVLHGMHVAAQSPVLGAKNAEATRAEARQEKSRA